MLFPIGLFLVVCAISVAAYRTRPLWWMWVVGLLTVFGVLWSILSIVGVTAQLHPNAAAWIGWPYATIAGLTLLASVFVLERRGWYGEEAPPLIGDNPLDGDTNDDDDPDTHEGFEPFEPGVQR